MASQSKSTAEQEALGKIMGPESPPAPPLPPPPTSVPPAAQAQGESSSPPRRKNPRLDHWSVLLAEDDPGSPIGFKSRLRGEIHGHPNPKFSDGEIVTSSPLFSLDVAGKVARTKNTVYELGEPDPTYMEYVEKIGKKLRLQFRLRRERPQKSKEAVRWRDNQTESQGR